MNEENKKIFICENPDCKKEHDGSYGSGRFCSDHCRRVYCGKRININGNQKCNFNNAKHNKHSKLKRSPYGTWKCEQCNLVFETRAKLYEHNKEFHPVPKGKAWNSGKTMKNEPRLCKSSNTLKTSYRSGKCKHPLKGKKHTEKEKDKIRIGYSKYIERKSNKTRVNYNVNSISIIESIGKEYGWNFQHAENGGEVIVLGYWLDAYDKEHNVVLEFDEKRHYIDVVNNILNEADLKRQQKIIDYLHCEFWRYNEITGKLWRVDK